MKGIRRRILTGFLSIVVLLFFSGMVSLYELNHMSGDITAILDGSKKGIALSENILKSLREHDKAVVNYVFLQDFTYSERCNTSIKTVKSQVLDARSKSAKILYTKFDSLTMVISSMEENVSKLTESKVIEKLSLIDTLQRNNSQFKADVWYGEKFAPLYDDAMHRVIQVMTDAHNALTPRAERLSNNAYRAVTPVFISLLIMIVILLVFYFFIMHYIGKPVIQINKSLDDTIRYKIPFSVKAECHDEVLGIKEKLEKVFNNQRPLK